MSELRLKEIADKTGKTIDEVAKEFSTFIQESFSDAWKDSQGILSNIEDEDFFFFWHVFQILDNIIGNFYTRIRIIC